MSNLKAKKAIIFRYDFITERAFDKVLSGLFPDISADEQNEINKITINCHGMTADRDFGDEVDIT